MDDWASQYVGSGHTRESAHRARPLSTTSGNTQQFSVEAKSHFDFKRPRLGPTRAFSEPHFTPPALSYEQDVSAGLIARKARKFTHEKARLLRERPWLSHPKYKQYRTRKRQDAGKDGKAIWPDYIEEAFQNALIHIPPMGRKKKSHYGKNYGRNELIKEWILQETGEVRDRKQVSSHIQVLGNFLKEVPEWKQLTAGNEEEDNMDDVISEIDNGFPYETISDHVRLQRRLAKEAIMFGLDEAGWMDFIGRHHTLQRITFDMFVAMPDKMTEAMHTYTRIVQSQPTNEPAPLENYHNWRELFPDLEKLLVASTGDQFDIIFLKSRFSLMTDFPPPTSKLGLVLDLDFRDNTGLSNLRNISSVNHMYLHGKRFRKTEHTVSEDVEPGLVKLFFEAEWWATQFTDLIHKRKTAEDTGDAHALEIAEDHSKSMFRGLTIMQEVFTTPRIGDHASQPRRVAVLLWAFAQTNTRNANATTWQKVLPPPGRVATNSPLIKSDVDVPPLSMDSTIDMSFDNPSSAEFSSSSLMPHLPLSPTIYEANAYHSGFTPLQATFNYASTGFTPTYAATKHVPVSFSTVQPPYPAPPILPSQNHIETMFDIMPQDTHNEVLLDVPAAYQVPQIAPSPSIEHTRRRELLANFDMSTHNMLQEQLADFEDAGDATELLPPTDPDSQHSMIGHMNDLELDVEQLSQIMNTAVPTEVTPSEETTVANHVEKLMMEHPSAFDSPKLTRPPLMAHHSFAVLPNTQTADDPDIETEHITFDTPTRNEFARLMNHHIDTTHNEEDLFGNSQAVLDMLHFPPTDFMRPRSQPVLTSNDTSMDFDTPRHSKIHDALPQVKVELS